MRNLLFVLLAGLITVVAAAPALAQATDPISVLKSDAPLNVKQDACRQLSIKGTKDAVPVLASLLTDEKLSHMARYALEPMPFPEAGKALRDALGKTKGRLKVGIVKSLAVRKDVEAVPQLIKALRDKDGDVAQAAARALGTIGDPKGEKALDRAIAQKKLAPGMRDALCDGLYTVAEQHVQKKQGDQAVKIYDGILRLKDTTPPIVTAALRGAVMNRNGDQGVPLLAERLRGDDENAFAAALRISREMSGNHAVTTALASALPGVPPARKVRILDVFGKNDGDTAGAAALALAKDGDVDVRVAALRAVTRMKYTPALPVLAQLATADDEKIATVAQSSLAYFPGTDRNATLEGLLSSDQPKARRVAVQLIGEGGLDSPVALLIKTAQTDNDESVRVAALEGLRDSAGAGELPALLNALLKSKSSAQSHAAESTLTALCERQRETPGAIVVQKAVYGDLPNGKSASVVDQVSRLVASGARTVDATNGNFGEPAPNVVKKLRVDYTDNGTPVSKTVNENETLTFSVAAAPPSVVDPLCKAFQQAQGDTKIAVLRILGVAGGQKAFGVVRAATNVAATKQTALQTLCNWPTSDALPAVMDLAKSSPDPAIKGMALRGAVRLLGQSTESPDKILAHYAALTTLAKSPEDKKVVLSGLTQVSNAGALDLAFAQFGDTAVKAEAVQAAIAIAKNIGKTATEDKTLFNGSDLKGWQGNTKIWRVEGGALVGQNREPITHDEILASAAKTSDFYLVTDVTVEPNTGCGAIRFRQDKGAGYQVCVGQDAWGTLTAEPGKHETKAGDDAKKAVKPGQVNHCEILAVGPAVWVSINGKLAVAVLDANKSNARSGSIALELYPGAPQTIQFRIQKLVLNPKVELEGIASKDLISALQVAGK